MSKPLLCKHGYGAFACPHCPAAARRGRGGAIPLMVEEDRQRRELDDALSVLRDLVAYWDATHPHAVDPDMDAGLRTRLVEQGADLRRRARSLVAEHPTNEETP